MNIICGGGGLCQKNLVTVFEYFELFFKWLYFYGNCKHHLMSDFLRSNAFPGQIAYGTATVLYLAQFIINYIYSLTHFFFLAKAVQSPLLQCVCQIARSRLQNVVQSHQKHTSLLPKHNRLSKRNSPLIYSTVRYKYAQHTRQRL